MCHPRCGFRPLLRHPLNLAQQILPSEELLLAALSPGPQRKTRRTLPPYRIPFRRPRGPCPLPPGVNSELQEFSPPRHQISQPGRRVQEGKPTTSLIVSIYPGDAPTIGSSIRLFPRSRTIERAYSSNRYTQCNNCWGFGHIAPQARCPSTSPVCPICSLNHTRASHHCPNPTCPGGGNLKTTPGCCSSSPAHGTNCGGDHTAIYRDCESRPTPPTVRRSATAAEIVPAPPVGDAMDTAANDQDILPTPSHTRSLQSAFEMATPRAIRTTILPASVRRTQGTGSLSPVEPASPSPMSRTPSGLAH